jgi:hypothetical protein
MRRGMADVAVPSEVMLNRWAAHGIELAQHAMRIVALLGAPVLLAAPVLAHGSSPQPHAPEPHALDTIVVTAQRLADAELKTEVQLALRDDATLLADHLDVSVKNGVVTLSGLVFDDWDLRIARRVAKRIPGVKRVINDMEIKLGGE